MRTIEEVSCSITEVPWVALKDCPYCGKESGIFRYDNEVIGRPQYYAECMNELCDVRPATLMKDSIAEARSIWNTRHSDAKDYGTPADLMEDEVLEKEEEQFCLPAWWESLRKKKDSLNEKIIECDVLAPDGLIEFFDLLCEKKSLTN